MKILLASHNAHKAAEVADILAGTGLEVVNLSDFPEITELGEDHDTFSANALQKAREAHAATGLLVVADDSGIEVDALDGAPGVHSKRFSEQATADANNTLLLQKLDGITNRSARFRCVIAVVGDGIECIADGSCEGTIALERTGEGGFGYDPLFLPEEAPGRSMAELSAAEKNAISHRGRAFEQLPSLLEAVKGLT
ncbi:MAG: XTP/dITP diphosphohydrolase [Myxococcota bacterium]|jgi:XTP/dITP diphosphohydrolase